MDERDSAILRELQLNARLTNRQLATRVGLAPSSCLARVRALEQSGVISGYHAQVDLERIGRGIEALIAFQIRPLSRAVIHAFKAFALEQPEVLDVYVVGGGDDFLLHLAVPTVGAMHEMLMDRFSKRKEVIGFRTSILYEHTRQLATAPSRHGAERL